MSIEQREHDARQPDAAARMSQHFEAMHDAEDRQRWDVVLMAVGVAVTFIGFGAAVWWVL